MEFPEEIHENIEDYVENRLEGDSRRQFEMQLEICYSVESRAIPV